MLTLKSKNHIAPYDILSLKRKQKVFQLRYKYHVLLLDFEFLSSLAQKININNQNMNTSESIIEVVADCLK